MRSTSESGKVDSNDRKMEKMMGVKNIKFSIIFKFQAIPEDEIHKKKIK